MARLILFAVIIALGVNSMFSDAEVIKELVTNCFFFAGGCVVLVFGLNIFKDALKG